MLNFKCLMLKNTPTNHPSDVEQCWSITTITKHIILTSPLSEPLLHPRRLIPSSPVQGPPPSGQRLTHPPHPLGALHPGGLAMVEPQRDPHGVVVHHHGSTSSWPPRFLSSCPSSWWFLHFLLFSHLLPVAPGVSTVAPLLLLLLLLLRPPPRPLPSSLDGPVCEGGPCSASPAQRHFNSRSLLPVVWGRP